MYTLNARLQIPSDTTWEGGYTISNGVWTKTTPPDPLPAADSGVGVTNLRRANTALSGSASAPRLVAVEVSGRSNFYLMDLTISTEDATLNGASVYGIHMRDVSNYRLVRVRVEAGNAAKGITGDAGVDGANGQDGSNGQDYRDDVDSCVIVGGGGSGGGGGVDGAPAIGSACTVCVNIDSPGNPGSDGDDSDGPIGLSGQGGGAGGTGGCAGSGAGFGGRGGFGGFAGENGNAGTPPTGTGVAAECGNGLDGGDAACTFDTISTVADGAVAGPVGIHHVSGVNQAYYQPGTPGESGEDGFGAQGGCGGGGGGGENGNVVCDDSTGATGGGGGGGGEAGYGGGGGFGGGGSFAVYLYDNDVNGRIEDCLFNSGSGGPGGDGGPGGVGGTGGQGGLGGAGGTPGGGAGGDGQDGDTGGAGGAGATGSVGLVAALYEGGPSPTPLVTSVTTYTFPTAQISVSVTDFCTGSIYSYGCVGSCGCDAGSCIWSSSPGATPASTAADAQTYTTSYSSVGFKSLQLVQSGTTTYDLVDFLNVVLPEHTLTIGFETSFSTSVYDMCDNESVAVAASDNSLAAYDWYFDGAGPANASGADLGPLYMHNVGIFDVTLTATDNFCGPRTFVRQLEVQDRSVCNCTTNRRDCNDQCYGNATTTGDYCGVCWSGTTGITAPNSTLDCNGDCAPWPLGRATINDCGICTGGLTLLSNDTGKDCLGVCNGTATFDCNGVCAGNATRDGDACNVCWGGNTGIATANSTLDCNGDCGGSAQNDDCGVCYGGTTGVAINSTMDCAFICDGTTPEDCLDVCNGTAVDDCNGVCAGNATTAGDYCGVCWSGTTGIATPNSTLDCNGDCAPWPLGPATINDCGICTGGLTMLSNDTGKDCLGVCNGTAILDCNGDCNGNATRDSCNVCWGGNTGVAAPNSTRDCNGDCGGSAAYDSCGVCFGGTTGVGINSTMDCAGICDGTTPGDCFNVCNGTAVDDCNGDCDGTATTAGDFCGVCWGGNTGIAAPNSTLDCNVDCGGGAALDTCDVCWGGATGVAINSTMDCAGECDGLAVPDCADVCGGTAFRDDCFECVGGTTGLTENYLYDECDICNGNNACLNTQVCLLAFLPGCVCVCVCVSVCVSV